MAACSVARRRSAASLVVSLVVRSASSATTRAIGWDAPRARRRILVWREGEGAVSNDKMHPCVFECVWREGGEGQSVTARWCSTLASVYVWRKGGGCVQSVRTQW